MAERIAPAAGENLVMDHHHQIRVAYLGGFSFLVYEGAVWLASAASADIFSVKTAIIVLVVGGSLSPVGALIIQKLLRRPVVGSDNPLIRLSVTSAFMIPLSYPVIVAATLADTNWFFPAFAVVVGAHFMPYAHIYHMHNYLALGGVLVIGASMIGYLQPNSFSPAGYFTGAVLVTFSVLLLTTVKREINRDANALDTRHLR